MQYQLSMHGVKSDCAAHAPLPVPLDYITISFNFEFPSLRPLAWN